MQAVVLAGGEGSRLRPLTSTVPKPVVTLVDRPFIGYMLEWLSGHGVDSVVMSCGFLADGVRKVLGNGSSFGLSIQYVEEPEPLGTAGAVKLAEPYLDETFLVLNGDVLTDIDLTAQVQWHRSVGAQATLALIGVDDPSAYGLVQRAEDGSVERFTEKPGADLPSNPLINAGAYVMRRSVLEPLEVGVNASFEHDVFPQLVGKGLYGYEATGYWIDIGTPARYLQATRDILGGTVTTKVQERLGPGGLFITGDTPVGAEVSAPALIESGCRIDPAAKVGPFTVLGENVTVGAGSSIERSVVLEGAQIGQGCVLKDCVVGARAKLGDKSQLKGCVVVGEDVTVGAGNTLAGGARIFPGIEIPQEAIKF